MNDDEFFDRLRGEARKLRFDGAPGAHERIRAGVRAGIDRGESLTEVLLGWFRPLAAGLSALTLVAAAAIWMQQPVAGDLLASSDAAPLTEDYYHVAE